MTGHWLARETTIRLLWIVFGLVLLTTVLAGGLIERHGYFGVDGTFAFNAWYGLGSCVGMILFAKGLALLLKRPDTYYDDA